MHVDRLLVEIFDLIECRVLEWTQVSVLGRYLAPGPVFLRHAKCARHGRPTFHTVDNIYETS